MNKIINTFSYLVLLGTFIAMCLVIYWMSYTYQPLTFNGEMNKVSQKIVYQGNTLNYEVSYCKNTKLSSVVSRRFINDLIYLLPDTVANNPSGCHDINFLLSIPKELPPAKYKILTIYKYQINPIREIIIERYTEEFEVLEATPSAK
jgi:hypothetical protein